MYIRGSVQGYPILFTTDTGATLNQLGPVKVQAEAIVAKIDDDALFGVDVLQNSEEGPIDLLMSKGMLRVAGG